LSKEAANKKIQPAWLCVPCWYRDCGDLAALFAFELSFMDLQQVILDLFTTDMLWK
jgi:hypothetical protein